MVKIQPKADRLASLHWAVKPGIPDQAGLVELSLVFKCGGAFGAQLYQLTGVDTRSLLHYTMTGSLGR